MLPAEQKGLLPELRRRIEAGETLAALAAEHSKCPSRGCGACPRVHPLLCTQRYAPSAALPAS